MAKKKDIKLNEEFLDGEDLLESAMMRLVFKEPFFANLIMNMKREYTTRIPTVGVSVTDTINLVVNPHFWASCSVDEQIDILKHECYHVINNHFVRFRDLDPNLFEKLESKVKSVDDVMKKIEAQSDFSILNQSADYAINEYLPNLQNMKMQIFDENGKAMVEPDQIPDGKGGQKPNPNAGKNMVGEPCIVKMLKKKHPKVDNLQNMEYYYEFLKEEKGNGDEDGQGEGGQQPSRGRTRVMAIDDHSLWNEGDVDAEYVTEKVKDIVNKAVEQTEERSAGKIPSEVLQAIEILNHRPKNWKQDLQRFVARTTNIKIEQTRKRRNRRYGIYQAGYRVYPELHLAVCVDTSGSVADEELTQFMTEIDRIHRNNVKVTIIEFDTKVNQIYDFDPKKKIEVKGRGGTIFKHAFVEAIKMNVDGVICFTDGGDCDNNCPKPKVPTLWALIGANAESCLPYKWGAKTTVEIKKKRK